MGVSEGDEDKIVRANLFSVSRSRKDKVLQKYGNSEVLNEKGEKRGVGSSQGPRWVKSQSLAVSREQKGFRHLIRHFHKHNSILV